MNPVIEFTRGDGVHHSFSIPAANWSPGGKLFFAAKAQIDDDATDSAALIDIAWDDSAVSGTTINGVAFKTYDCYFPPSATKSIVSNGLDVLDALGEFQYVPSVGDPVTFPADNHKIDVKIYFDIKIKAV